MRKYVLKRLLIAIPTFLGITLVVFALCYNATGSPLELLLSDPNISEAEVARRAGELGLNDPFHIQYISWIKNFFCGNLGFSYRTSQPVMEMLMDGMSIHQIAAEEEADYASVYESIQAAKKKIKKKFVKPPHQNGPFFSVW